MSKAQEWARGRNGAKWRVTGVVATLQTLSAEPSLLATERGELRRSILLLKETLGCWKARTGLSKKKFMEGK